MFPSHDQDGLVHDNAITEWFNLYQADVLDGIENIGDKLVNPNLNLAAPESEAVEKKAEADKDINSESLTKKTNFTQNPISNFPDYSFNLIIPRAQALNWEMLGRIEAHNFYNSVENITLIGQIINKNGNVGEFYDKIIKSLNIPKEDIYEDWHNEAYRYDSPLTLNRVANKDGGSVTILPDIHEMDCPSLLRIKESNFDGVPLATNNTNFVITPSRSFLVIKTMHKHQKPPKE